MDLHSEYILASYTHVKNLAVKPANRVSLVVDETDAKIYIRKDNDTKDGFNTCRSLAPLRHKNLPVIHHVIDTGSGYTVIEEYIQGELLLYKAGFITEAEAVNILVQLCEVLAFLHMRPNPIIHRDIKPANIIRTGEGTIKLIDFNASKEYDPAKSADTTTLGTQIYAAPEQFGYSPSDTRTDIYGVGATMFHLTTGKPYIPGKSVYPRPGRLFPVIMKCLQVDPDKRYANAFVLLKALYTGNRHPFPDMVDMPKTAKSVLVFVYAVCTLFFIINTLTVLLDLMENGLPKITVPFKYVGLHLIPYILICNPFGLRSRLPYFRNKRPLVMAPGLIKFLVISVFVVFAFVLIYYFRSSEIILPE
jgi:serine/threonine protein kinase